MDLLFGDYKAQFGMLRDYAYELLNKNPDLTMKIDVDTNENAESIFKIIYIHVGSLKRGFLDECRRVLCLDAYFLKGPWDG